MPHIDSMKVSKFLKKEDVGAGVNVTIKNVIEENVAQEGKAPEMKWCIYFYEFDKAMVSNVVNRDMIAHLLNQPNTDNWPNGKVKLWNDPSVTFGQIRGGIRVLPADIQGAAQTHTQPQMPRVNPAVPQGNPADPHGINDDIPW